MRYHLASFLSVLGTILILLYAFLNSAQAQTTVITPDASLGTNVTQSGSLHTITGGTIEGSNLFHSFERFDLGTGNIAQFNGPNSIHHILSRVTGGTPSLINGTLRSGIAGANLFLLNPAGVLFGSGARLEVDGSFHASTADLIRLQDGSQFRADLSTPSVLSLAEPVAFGFLQERPSGIEVDRSRLEVPQGEGLSLVGGEIEITGRFSRFLRAPGGEIRLVSVSSTGEVGLDGGGPEVEQESAVRGGLIQLTRGALLDADGEVGGRIHLEGGEIRLEGGSVLSADTEGEGGDVPGGILVEAGGTLSLLDASEIANTTLGSSPAGDVTVTADTLIIDGGSFIRSNTSGVGSSGRVTVRVSEGLTITGANPVDGFPSGVFSTSEPGAEGSAGGVAVEARTATLSGGGEIASSALGAGDSGGVTIRVSETLTIAEPDPRHGFPSGIFTQADVDSSGDAGDLVIEAKNLTITDGGLIDTGTLGSGNGGRSTIRVSDTITITGTTTDGFRSAILSQSGSAELDAGSAGDITIEATNLILADGGVISGGTFGSGDGGRITIRTSETVTLSGTDENGLESLIFASSTGTGAGGEILIEAANLTLTDGARISGGTTGSGDGGRITVRTSGTTTLSGTDENGFASIIEVGSDGTGTGGEMLIETNAFILEDGARISGFISGSGGGGRLTIRASETMTLSGRDRDGSPSAIFADSIGTGAAGDITIEATNLILTDGTLIQSDTLHSGDGGNVTIDAVDLTLIDGAQISGSTLDSGNGSTVTIRASNTLTITGVDTTNGFPSAIFAGSRGTGAAGAMRVEAADITIRNGGQLSSSAFDSGNGGNVTVRASGTLTIAGRNPLTGDTSGIFTSSEQTATGTAGTLEIEATDLTLTGGGQIASGTFGSGDGGQVTVRVSETLTIIGGAAIGDTVSGISTDSQGTGATAGAAGALEIEATTLTIMEGGQISSSTFGSGDGGQVTIRTRETLTIDGVDPAFGTPGGIFTNSEGTGAGTGATGDMVIDAGNLTVAGGGLIIGSSFGSGNGGRITIRVRDALTVTGSGILASGSGTGAAGDLMIETTDLTLTEGGQIASDTLGPGQGGQVAIRVSETLTIDGSTPKDDFFTSISANSRGTVAGAGGGGAVSIETTDLMLIAGGRISSETFGPGDAGTVTIHATGTITINGSHPEFDFVSGIFANSQTAATGSAGDVEVEAMDLSLTDGGAISSSTFGSGDAGRVLVRTSQTVSIAGSDLDSGSFSGIFSGSFSTETATGMSGDVIVEAMDLSITDGGTISSSTSGSGDAGRVVVRTSQTLSIAGSDPNSGSLSGIFSESLGTETATGMSGDVIVEATALNLMDGGLIGASTFTSGDGGSVTVRVSETMRLTGTTSDGSSSGVDVSSFGAGNSGNLSIRARDLQLADGAAITAQAIESGTAGSLSLDVAQTLLIDQSDISTSALQADGGDLRITANIIQLRDAQMTTSVGSGQGSGGNITIEAQLGMLKRGEIRANAFGGPGGNITITTEGFLQDTASVVSASSTQSVDGLVEVQGVIDLSGSLLPIDLGFAAALAVLPERCATRVQTGGISSFVTGGRDRIPTNPAQVLSSPPMRPILPESEVAGSLSLEPLFSLTAMRPGCRP